VQQIRRQINAVDRVVIMTVIGELWDQELLSLANELKKEPQVEPDFSLLIDLRQAKGGNVTRVGVSALAKVPLALSPASRRAVVVPSELGFGMARMYGLMRDERDGTMQVFRDFDEAQRWVATGVR
jgi:hypothetical protein